VEQFNLKPVTSWTQKFYAEINPTSWTYYCRDETSQFKYSWKFPFTWEKIAVFTHQFSVLCFGLGSGLSPALHNPDYDFPDEIIPTGINLFHQISKQILNAH
jgi:metal-dependent amidase/aminoacylase/carboxypeptidase family protein